MMHVDPYLQALITFLFGMALLALGVVFVVPWADRLLDRLDRLDRRGRRPLPPAE
jgi:hypothetical protein